MFSHPEPSIANVGVQTVLSVSASDGYGSWGLHLFFCSSSCDEGMTELRIRWECVPRVGFCI